MHIKSTALCGVLALAALACAPNPQAPTPTSTAQPASAAATTATSASAATSAQSWQTVSGVFVREGSSQPNSGELVISNFQDNIKLFQFETLSEDESQGEAKSFMYASTMSVDPQGIGHWEGEINGKMGHIDFKLAADGKSIEVIHSGQVPFACDGRYVLDPNQKTVPMSLNLAQALVEELPPAATSLNLAQKDYTFRLHPEPLPDTGFYKLEALSKEKGEPFAEFWVSPDLTVVIRADAEPQPTTIFGGKK